MSTLTVTITPSEVVALHAQWCIKGVSDWKYSGESVDYTWRSGLYIIFRYIEGFQTPSDVEISTTIRDAGAYEATYGIDSWPSEFGVPICGCEFRGQVFFGGRLESSETPSKTRLVQWSEIGAFRFLGATANTLKNEAGYIYVGSFPDEKVMCMLPLKGKVVCYTNKTISMFRPVEQPAPTYSFDEFLPIGILNPLAVAGSEMKHVAVCADGNLREIYIDQYGQYIYKTVGYKNIFSELQENFSMEDRIGVVVVTYYPDADEFYISNGTRSFLYKNGLTELRHGVASLFNLQSVQGLNFFVDKETQTKVGVLYDLLESNLIYLETEPFDFDIGGAIKTIQQVAIEANLPEGATMQVMVKWRNSKNSEFSNTTWKRCSPTGVVYPVVSGVEFVICISVDTTEDVCIYNMTIEWQLHDKTSVRGVYVGGSNT